MLDLVDILKRASAPGADPEQTELHVDVPTSEGLEDEEDSDDDAVTRLLSSSQPTPMGNNAKGGILAPYLAKSLWESDGLGQKMLDEVLGAGALPDAAHLPEWLDERLGDFKEVRRLACGGELSTNGANVAVPKPSEANHHAPPRPCLLLSGHGPLYDQRHARSRPRHPHQPGRQVVAGKSRAGSTGGKTHMPGMSRSGPGHLVHRRCVSRLPRDVGNMV